MEGNCMVENKVCQAKTEVENWNIPNKERIYIGATENEWKKRYYNHKFQVY